MTLFSLAGSLNYASHTQPPESDLERKMSDTCGPKCAESFGRFNHVGLWAKTFSALLIGTGDWYSTRCKLTWKLKGTKYNRLYFQLQASTLPTNGTEFGLWPTPRAQEPGKTSEGYGACLTDVIQGKKMQHLLKTPTAMDGEVTSGKKNPVSGNSGTLAQEIMSGYKPTMEKLGLLLTPTTREEVVDLDKFKKRMEKYPNGTTMPNLATQVVGMLPTPNTRDYKGARSTEALENSGRNHTNSLPDSFSQTGKTSQLNPRFVLEMMGFPPNWTELPFLNGETNQSRQGETPLCPK